MSSIKIRDGGGVKTVVPYSRDIMARERDNSAIIVRIGMLY